MIADLKIPFDINPVPAYYTEPELGSKHPAIILIHEIWGVNDHMKDVASRLMQQGYAVLVPDLLYDTNISEKVSAEVFDDFKNPDKRDEVQIKMREVFAPVHSPEFAQETIAKLQACFTYLQQ